MLSHAVASLAVFKRRLIVFAGFFLVLIWGLSLYDLWRLHAEREAAARREATAVATALGDYVVSLVQASSTAMQGLARGIKRALKPGERKPFTMGELLARQDEQASDDVFSFAFFDTQGRSVANSDTGFPIGRDFSDRKHIAVHLQGSDKHLYVGAPVVGRIFGKPILPVSRRVETDEKELLGVLVASLDARLIAKYFSRFDLGAHGAVVLAHTDGKVVARWPDFEKNFGQDVSTSPLFTEHLALAEEGNYDSVSVLNGEASLFHYRRLEKYPLVIAVAFARRDLINDMAGDIVAHFVLALLGSLIVVVGARRLWQAERRTANTLVSLEFSEKRYRGLYDSIGDGIAMRDLDGSILDCNRRFCELVEARRDEVLGRQASDLAPLGMRGATWERAAAQLRERGDCDEFEREYRASDGRRRFVSIRSWMVGDGEGGYQWLVVRDVTEKKIYEEKLLLARRIIEGSNEAIMITDLEFKLVAINGAVEKMLGYTESEVIGRPAQIFDAESDSRESYEAIWGCLMGEGHWEGELWDRRKNGEVFPAWVRMSALRDDGRNGDATHFVTMLTDISERKAAEERIRYLALNDPLTGLPNRVSLNDMLLVTLAAAKKAEERVAVFFIDLDNFKTINDSLGHHVGDAILVEVAERLRQAVRQSDIVARLGGDEFLIVLPNVGRTETVAQIARKIVEILGGVHAVDGHVLYSTASIGISFFPDDADNADDLLRHADTAMYYAKAGSRNNFQFFSKPMNVAANQRLVLENTLWGAIEGGQLQLHYQPQVDMLRGQIIGMEALLRWNHPQLGMVSPADFIPVAEESGAIVPIGAWVLETACRQGRRWLDSGRDCGCLAVNVSTRQFRSAGFVETVAGILDTTGFPADRLELEITETAVMGSAESATQTMQRLRTMGIRLAIDDFGTGYSSLSYLHSFPVNRLKIDRNFVNGIPDDAAMTSLVAAIIALGEALGLELLAEGVENDVQTGFLVKHGCLIGQGFHYYRPMTAASLEPLLPECAVTADAME